MANIDTYDYVVVGGGTAGCAVAGRLTQHPDIRVLLLEAGPPSGPAQMSDPGAWMTLLGGESDWDYTTTPQSGLGDRTLRWPRGRVLGGSGSINGMVFLRGRREDYDAWHESGATGWAYRDLLPYFKRAEHAEGPRARRYGAQRGFDGPMRVGQVSRRHPISTALVDSMVAAGFPEAADINDADEEGAFWTDLNIADGERLSAADGYLRPVMAERPNLFVETGALVHRLTVRGGRCTGVEYVVGGERRAAAAAGEVLLAAGTIGSAQLLLLSGIGPAGHLSDVGVELVHDLPGVGGNLHDHPACDVVFTVGDRQVEFADRAESGGLLRSEQSLVEPDVHILSAPISTVYEASGAPAGSYAFGVALLAPASRGSLRLRDADPESAPLLDPNYLAVESDMAAMVAAVGLARELGRSSSFDDLCEGELMPGPDVDDDASLRDFIRRRTGGYFHLAGTCRIGTDDSAVVDPSLRVHGIEGLRVIDASVMPTVPRAGTNCTVFAIAERAVDLVLADRR